MESIVRSVSEKKIINTGFLKGPVCPIYGIGAIIMLLFLERYQNKPILLFFIAIIVLTTWEYLVGVLLEKIMLYQACNQSNSCKLDSYGNLLKQNDGTLITTYDKNFVSQLLELEN